MAHQSHLQEKQHREEEESKDVMTRSILVALKENENGIGAEKQQLVSNLELEPVVEFLSESEEELEVDDE